MTSNEPTHVLDWPELKAWLTEYGLNADHVIEAHVVLGRRSGGLGAWLDVEWYKLDSRGQLYVDPDNRDEAARGRSSIPLRSWPPLRQLMAEKTVVCPRCGAAAEVEYVAAPTWSGYERSVPGSYRCANGHTFATPG